MDVDTMIRKFYEGMSTGDTGLADELIAPDHEDIPVVPGTSGGPEGYRATVAFLRTAFPDLTMTIEDTVVAGDRVAVRSTARGTHAGDFLGVPATGRRVEFPAFDFHLVVDGKFRRSWHLEDNLGLLAQIRPDAGS